MNAHPYDYSPTEQLRTRLSDDDDVLRAIRGGEIDALVIESEARPQVFILHSADEPYRQLVEDMEQGAVVFTGRGEVLYANERFAALVGEPLEAVVGTFVERFVSPSDREAFSRLIAAGRGACRSRLVGSASGSLEVALSLTTTATSDGGRLNLTVTDLTELLAATTSRDRAERESRTKDEFLAMLAHELRNPLMAIGSAVQVLGLTETSGRASSRAQEVIARQLHHISALIDELIDVERVGTGKIRLTKAPLDLARAVDRAVTTVMDGIATDRHVEVTVTEVWIDGDPVRIEQILTNVLTNAIKYTSDGGIIRVHLCADGADALLTVEDNGAGISAALRPFIFALYAQGERTLSRSRGGLGIGLSLVRRLVELHGGTIEASSEGEDRGSRFTIRLRRIPALESAS